VCGVERRMGEVKAGGGGGETGVDNMATLPVGPRSHPPATSEVTPEKNNSTNKEMEAKKSKAPPKESQQPSPKRYVPPPPCMSHPLSSNHLIDTLQKNIGHYYTPHSLLSILRKKK
jgi:hypothetical protein